MTRLAARRVGVALLAALAFCAGCSTPTKRYYFGGLSNPFGRANPEDERRYGPVQRQVRSEIHELAQQASRMPPQDQEKVAHELSERLRQETNPGLRVDLVRALSALSTQSAEVAVQAALADGDKRVRVAGVQAWQRRGGSQAVAALSRAAVDDADLDVRLAAVRALGEMRQPEATAPLVAVLEENNPALEHRTIESLQAISGRNYGGDKQAWRLYAQGNPPPEPPREQSWAELVWPWR